MPDEETKKIDIEVIGRRIQDEAAARRAEGPRFSRQDRLHSRTPKSNHTNPVKKETRLYRFAKKVQHKIRKYPFYSIAYNTAYKFKQFIPKYDEGIRIGEFLQYHDEDFVMKAYQGILGREADTRGFYNYLSKLRNGHLSKTEVLGKLRYSREGKEKGLSIKGLFLRYVIATSYRVPVIGYALSLTSTLIRLPKIIKNIQQYEAFTSARFTQHVETFSKLASNIHAVSQGVNDLSAETNVMATDIIRITTDISRNSTDISMNSAIISRIEIDFKKTKDDSNATFVQLKSFIENLMDTKAESQTVSSLAKQIYNHNSEILNLQNSLRHFFEEMRIKLSGTLPEDHITELQREEEHLLDALYVAFEDQFRGKREDIKERTKVYLSYIERAKAGTDDGIVLDIGCGRGEWLELLGENGYKAIGIDNNRIMVGQCRKLELEVIDGDALQYLTKQKQDTFGAITGLHIVEHLPLSVLIQLLDEVLRTLKPGGVAIFETPNPENIMVGATFFRIDPTHNNPVHPLTMDFLLGQRGFVKTEIRRLHAMPSQPVENKMLHDLLFGPQDYAVIGYKR